MNDAQEHLKDLLLQDYKYRADSLRDSEHAGETRVTLFTGLVSVVAASLVALSNAQHGPSPSSLRVVIECAVVLLTAVGWLTLMRLLIRNDHTDECKRDLDHIRQVFKNQFDRDGHLVGYSPVGNFRQSANIGARRFGGLAHLMAGFNSLLMGVAVFAALLGIAQPGKFQLDASDLLQPSFAAIVAVVLGFLLQSQYVTSRERLRKCEWSYLIPTHAGGVVFKRVGEDLMYLIVSPRAAAVKQWVFPNCHIANGETPEAAAVRKVEEEASGLVCVRGDLGLVRLSTASSDTRSDIVAKFYLMEWLVDVAGASRENREQRWLPFHEAVLALSFIESKRLLTAAYLKTTS